MAQALFRDYKRLITRFELFKQLMRYECIQGFGIGRKSTSGKLLDELAVSVFVTEKMPLRRLSLNSRVPKVLSIPDDRSPDGTLQFLTDVQEARFNSLEFIARERPAMSGISIGHVDITAGTLGALFKDLKTGKPVILSNNHVLANSNNAAVGDPVLQPGPHDGGRFPDDQIAVLNRFLPIDFNDGAENRVDAAIATPLSPWHQSVEWRIRNIGTAVPTEARFLTDGDLGQFVHKTGRTTEHTQGFIQALHATVKVKYDFQVATFVDQIIVTQSPSEESFSDGGDSGSLICDSSNRAVGLLFAGSQGTAGRPGTTIANPIHHVMSSLDVDFLTPDDVKS